MKLYSILLAFIMILSIASFAIAESGSSNNQTSDSGNDSDSLDEVNESIEPTLYDDSDSNITTDNSNNARNIQRDRLRNDFKEDNEQLRGEFKERIRNESMEFKGEMRDLRTDFKERREGIREEYKLKIRSQNVTFNYTGDKFEFMVGKINAKTGLNLTVEDLENVSLGQVLRAYLSNGRWAEVKVMPDRASETALKKLHAKCEERNCTIELKEMYNNKTNESRIAYQINTEKDSKIFFLFKKKMKMVAEVDAETGEIISSHKPWWSFIAKEDNATNDEVENETILEDNSNNNSTSG